MFHRHSHREDGPRHGGRDNDGTSRGERFVHGMFGRHGRHEGRRGGLGRLFEHGDLKVVILRLIAEKPRHGYELIKEIEERLGGAYSPSPGVVYPTLTMLEELGYTTATATEGTKRLHAITPEGAEYLATNRSIVDSILARIGQIREMHGGGLAPQIIRAMENMKLALRMRTGRGPLDADQTARIAAILDAAATDIERS